MHKSTKRLFARIAIVTLIFEIIFQIGGALLINCGANIYKNEFFSMMISSILAAIVVMLLIGVQDVNLQYKRFSPLKYIWLLLLVFGIEGLSSLAMDPLINWLRNLGYTMESSFSAASDTNLNDIWDIIYATIGAPVIEESLYRGILYSHFRKYGRVFTIIITTFLFALMHLNIIQFLPAFFIGIVLCWTRDTYGIQYSIMIHMSTNLLAIVLNEFTSDGFYVQLLYLFLIFGGIITVFITLIVNAKKIYFALTHESHLGEMLMTWFTTISSLVITIFYCLLVVLNTVVD